MAKKIALSPAAIDGVTKGTLADLLTPGLAIEVLPSGKKRWRYRRQIAGSTVVVTMFGGLYPARAISEARAWAREQNEKVEAGLDPRAIQRDERARAEMTVAKAHELYMTAAREGRSSRAKRPNKEKTIAGKIKIYKANIAPTLSHRSIYDVTEDDLVRLVEKKGRTAKSMANRLAVELGVFFGWASSLKGCEVGLTFNPAKRLHDLHFPESLMGGYWTFRKLVGSCNLWFQKVVISSAGFCCCFYPQPAFRRCDRQKPLKFMAICGLSRQAGRKAPASIGLPSVHGAAL